MRAREFCTEDNKEIATTPWSRSENRDLIDMILNSVIDHGAAWSAAGRTARSIPGWEKAFNNSFTAVLPMANSRRLEYSISVMKNVLFGGESDGEGIGGSKKLALGGAIAALLWDSSNDRDSYPKIASTVFRMPLNNVARYARGGDGYYYQHE